MVPCVSIIILILFKKVCVCLSDRGFHKQSVFNGHLWDYGDFSCLVSVFLYVPNVAQ